MSGRGKLAGDMREIWLMQPRFEKRVGSTPFGMVEQPRFRAAFDFMRLRADAGEVEDVLADWWQEFSLADDNLRQDMVDEVRAEQQQSQRAPRVHKAPAPSAAREPVRGQEASDHDDDEDPSEGAQQPFSSESGDAPKKRRRRRRSTGARPAGEGAPDAGV